MFAELEEFVAARRACGNLAGDLRELTETGYQVRLICCCGASFESFYPSKLARLAVPFHLAGDPGRANEGEIGSDDRLCRPGLLLHWPRRAPGSGDINSPPPATA